ncbi:hypothetical protein ACJMK2_008092 [Sinanodonta woodiana]|uniref:Uncharacterized protein n=1 Tax=Sinanodonta woodiana TaxID=1069815 RepID=A0ABD3VM34_SINWO
MGSLEGTFDTKLNEAVRYGDIEEVKSALSHGYDPNMIGLYQWSAIHEAAHNGEVEILKLLLEKKGNPNKQDYLQSRTAVHYAAERGHVECLDLLVKARGRYDVKDNEGKNCLDVATPECRLILEKQQVQDLMKMSKSKSRKGNDDIQLESTTISPPINTVESLTVNNEDKMPDLGFLHMSVEYHAKKKTLKICVSQISDLLLPPSHASMIHAIYVQAFLQPDKKKESKRKTEEIKVESSQSHVHTTKSGKEVSGQHVFTPVSFKFKRPLEYEGIDKDVVKVKNLQLEVCLIQKFSRKVFLVGMLNMPLRTAVKKIVREKYPLIPCMNYTIPASMKVYSASELQITSSSKVFYSNPNVRVLSSSEISVDSARAVSDSDLKKITTYQTQPSPSIKITMPSESTSPYLDSIVIDSNESVNLNEIYIPMPGELDMEEQISNSESSIKGGNSPRASLEKDGIRTIDMENVSKSKVEKAMSALKGKLPMRSKAVKKLGSNKQDKDEDFEGEEYETVNMSPGIEDWKYYNIKQSGFGKHNKTGQTSSQLKTTAKIPVKADKSTFGSQEVIVPIETVVETRMSENAGMSVVSSKKTLDTVKKKSHQSFTVPEIIVSSPEKTSLKGEDRKKSKEQSRGEKDSDFVTPRNVTINIDDDDISHIKSGGKTHKSKDGDRRKQKSEKRDRHSKSRNSSHEGEVVLNMDVLSESLSDSVVIQLEPSVDALES